MVVCADRRASEIGVRIMQRGGNAVDAAVAVGFALAVVYPEAGNIGGGGFMIIRKYDGNSVMIDFRETAPRASTRNMFLDSAGNLNGKSVDGALSVAIPGTVDGLLMALDDYGSMKRADVLQPSIDLAENGFTINKETAAMLSEYERQLRPFPSTTRFYIRYGKLLQEGDSLKLPDLAVTLKRIKKEGADGFYRGETARLIVEEIKRGGGIIDLEDLASYRPDEKVPLRGSYREYDIITASPPSSGGVCLLELLNMVERFSFTGASSHSAQTVHVMAEAIKRMHADRAAFLGDPKFISNPAKILISKKYAESRVRDIDPLNATPVTDIHHGETAPHEGENTTHICVVDQEGNVVSMTYTLNDAFGSKVVVDGAGFFLNDEMDDFSSKPGVPNMFGLIGGEANAIEPGKKPLSSMAPTIVLKDDKPVIILGARGGPKIITSVFQTIVNVIDFGMNIKEAVSIPRFYHCWQPDTLEYETNAFENDVITDLQWRGYRLKEVKTPSLGRLQAIAIDPDSGWIYGGPDEREYGAAVGF
jgi:gamma-glutamyltranspeptidase / glutathione hydrolase